MTYDPKHPMSRDDQEMAALAKRALKSMPGRPKAERGLSIDHAAITIVTFTDGTTGRLFGFSHGRQITTYQRKTHKKVAHVERVICTGSGHGAVVENRGKFTLAPGFDLIPA